jgi:hypothetical protein
MKTRPRWDAFLDGTELLCVRTPWFALMLSCGGMDHCSNLWWWGVKLWWGGDWDAPEGQCLYRRYAEHVMRRYTHQQAVNSGGLPV